MSKCIVFNNPKTGMVSMVYATPEYLKAGGTLEKLAKIHVPKGIEFKIVLTSKISDADRYFRDAWSWNFKDDKIDISMEKAQDIHMKRLKYKRTLKWKKMGVPQNINAGLDEAFSETDKKTLKDLRKLESEDLKKFTDPESLKAYSPSYLD